MTRKLAPFLLALAGSLVASGTAAAVREEALAFGGTHNIAAGSTALPVRIFNPYLTATASEYARLVPLPEPVVFEPLPYRVPKGKTLLVYGLFLESDPSPGEPLLMALFATRGPYMQTLRTAHIREPRSYVDNLSSPIPLREGSTLNVMFSSGTASEQSFNWGIQARLVDARDGRRAAERIAHVRTDPWEMPSQIAPYPPLSLHWAESHRAQTLALLAPLSYRARAGSTGTQVVLQDDRAPERPAFADAQILLDLDTLRAGRVRRFEAGAFELDNLVGVEPGHRILAVEIAKAGTAPGVLVDPDALRDCAAVTGARFVALHSGTVHSFGACVPGQAGSGTASLAPGSIYLPLPPNADFPGPY